METSSATSGSLLIIHMKMRPTVGLGFSPALCSTAANLEAPVQNTPLSPTAATDPVSLTPSNAARAQHVRSRTPADLSATGGVTSTTSMLMESHKQGVSSEPAPPPPTCSCREPRVHSLLWRLRRMNAVDYVRTSPPVLELAHVRPVLKTTLTPPVKMSVEHPVGIVADPYWRKLGSVQQHLPAVSAVWVEQFRPRIIQDIMT